MTAKEASKIRYYDRKEKGLCQWCDKPAMPGRIRCEDHKAINREYAGGVRALRILKGLCTRCGKNQVTLFRECQNCRLKKSKNPAQANA